MSILKITVLIKGKPEDHLMNQISTIGGEHPTGVTPASTRPIPLVCWHGTYFQLKEKDVNYSLLLCDGQDYFC